MSFVISKHAYDQLKLRGISESLIWEILKTPGQVIRQDDKIIYQSIITEAGRQYLNTDFY